MEISRASRFARRLCAGSLGALLLAGGAAAQAHTPYFDDGTHVSAESAYRLPDAEVSRVLYAEVPCPNQPLWLSVEGEEGKALLVQLGTPVIEALADYRPSLAVLGPGLPAVEGLPFPVPEGVGGVIFATGHLADPAVFHERFTGTDSWILAEATVMLPERGTYHVVAFSEEDRRARLWVAVGTEERMEPSNVPDPLERVKAFHDGSTEPALGRSCADEGAEGAGVQRTGGAEGAAAEGAGGCAVGDAARGAGSGAAMAAMVGVAAALARRWRTRTRAR